MRFVQFFTLAWLTLSLARADVPPAQRAEVEHLLTWVQQSSCVFIRNGRKYTGQRAERHIMRKYEHFRDEIVDTGSFIELAASRSMASGRPYLIACDGYARPSRDVLLEELARHRNGRQDASALE